MRHWKVPGLQFAQVMASVYLAVRLGYAKVRIPFDPALEAILVNRAGLVVSTELNYDGNYETVIYTGA